ncbi:hypothetical protein HHI36_006352 [Cryptolaemus montrouzieri]|uniref:Triosephosphate isomerase n=1 Tax=Cryptolaemus montrouzieri TaxID=559131 RepID=A0ABD2NWZ6_9CUCU
MQAEKKNLPKKTCAEECRLTAQKLGLYCPPEKTFIVTGNWKMNGDKKIADQIIKLLRCSPIVKGNEVILGIPAPYLDYVQQRKPKFVSVAGQNVYKESKGPYTGEISADMLIDWGVKWVILGAAERRIYFHEDYDLIGAKAKYALDQGVKVLLCIGETAGQRECKEHIQALHKQLDTVLDYVDKPKWKNIMIVYEPLWTVGTGRTAELDEVQEAADAIRTWVKDNVDEEIAINIFIQFGGPMTPTTAKLYANLKDIDGLYVGAPSLKPEFIGIINANAKAE